VIELELVQSEAPALCIVWMLGLQHQLFLSTDLFSLVGFLGAVIGSMKPPPLLSQSLMSYLVKFLSKNIDYFIIYFP